MLVTGSDGLQYLISAKLLLQIALVAHPFCGLWEVTQTSRLQRAPMPEVQQMQMIYIFISGMLRKWQAAVAVLCYTTSLLCMCISYNIIGLAGNISLEVLLTVTH